MSKDLQCRVQDCPKSVGPKSARGYCDKHYARWRKHGDNFYTGHIQASPGAPEAHLRASLSYDGEACLIWPYGRDSDGYGLCRLEGRLMKASRAMCILAHGPPPFEGAEAAHNCGKGHEGCFSPNCIRWATRSENHLDKRRHGTMYRGEAAHQTKLTAAAALAIYNDKRPPSEIARIYGCTEGNVWCIQTGKTWSHVTGHDPSTVVAARKRRSPPKVISNENALAIYNDSRVARLIAADYGCSIGLVHMIKRGDARTAVTGHSV